VLLEVERDHMLESIAHGCCPVAWRLTMLGDGTLEAIDIMLGNDPPSPKPTHRAVAIQRPRAVGKKGCLSSLVHPNHPAPANRRSLFLRRFWGHSSLDVAARPWNGVLLKIEKLRCQPEPVKKLQNVSCCGDPNCTGACPVSTKPRPSLTSANVLPPQLHRRRC
jgi:hypothetical protein